MGIPWINRTALFRKPARIFTKSDAPQGAFLFHPMASPWENRPRKRIRPERAHSPARSIRKPGFLMGRPFRASCLITGSSPRRCHGLRVAYPFGAETLRLSLRVGITRDGCAIRHPVPPWTSADHSRQGVRKLRGYGLPSGAVPSVSSSSLLPPASGEDSS
jgi:hypothetical protein